MDQYAGAIIEGIYASTEGEADVALVTRVLAEVREAERMRLRANIGLAMEGLTDLVGDFAADEILRKLRNALTS